MSATTLHHGRTPSNALNLHGERFGRLLVVSEVDPTYLPSGHKTRRWLCKCDCGRECTANQNDLRRGHTRSCGCLQEDVQRERNTTHGHTGTNLYYVWSAMVQRCTNPRDKAYTNYGGRGITVCERWRDSFENFLADMGERPFVGATLERLDVNGPYSKENCIWASQKQQGRNRRNNRTLTCKGRTQSISAWAEELGVNRSTIHSRLRKGWTDEEIVLRAATDSMGDDNKR